MFLGWQLLNSRPQDLEKYLELKDSMSDFEFRLKKVKKPEVYAELQDEYVPLSLSHNKLYSLFIIYIYIG